MTGTLMTVKIAKIILMIFQLDEFPLPVRMCGTGFSVLAKSSYAISTGGDVVSMEAEGAVIHGYTCFSKDEFT